MQDYDQNQREMLFYMRGKIRWAPIKKHALSILWAYICQKVIH
jgi:hypothetical protein